MGRKFQGLAKNMCEIFLGYQSYEDLPEIERLGRGRYEVNVLTTMCKKDGIEIESFNISAALQKWFLTQLRMENIPLDEIQRAVLVINVADIQEHPYWLRLRKYWFRRRKYKWTEFNFECVSYINAYDCEYTAKDSGQRELG